MRSSWQFQIYAHLDITNEGCTFLQPNGPTSQRCLLQSWRFCSAIMTLVRRYVLRLFISLKYVTANVVDRNNGRIVATASTVEHSLKNTFECGRTCNAKAAASVVGEVLAMRLKVEGLEKGQGRGIHVDVDKEVEKKGFKNRTKIWAIVNALKNNGVKVVLDDDGGDNVAHPSGL